MKKWIVLGLVLLLILAGVLTFISSDLGNYMIVPKHTFSHTKAICTKDNFCQDYEIFCKNQEIISISPITGATIQFSKNWEDPRDEEIRGKFC